jgi:membrane-bound lytic murein transglycosylase D
MGSPNEGQGLFSFWKKWSRADKVMIGGAILLLTITNVFFIFYGQFIAGQEAQSEIKVIEVNAINVAENTHIETTKSDSTSALMPSLLTLEPTTKEVSLLTGPTTLAGSQIKTNKFDKESVLSDSENRINDSFNVTKTLHDRVSFWFDVYTKYDENDRVIHYSDRPWIVFKVVNVSDIINAKTPRRRWMRNEKADKHASLELRKIRAALASVAKKKSLKNLGAYEQMVVDALKPLGGKVQTHARNAAHGTRIQMGQKNFYETGLKISGRYLPEMEEIFAKSKLPIELTRLPLVESSFNKFATSKDGAAGIWQFMGDTGRKFMMINDSIDERRSPFKASEAAARLLKENHLILHRQWPLALTAYNHGPAGVRAAVKATGTKDLGTIAMKYRTKMFNFASANFYSSFLAALHAQMYKDKIWGSLDVDPALETYFVRLPKAYKASKLLKVTGLSEENLLLHNPDLRKIISSNGILPSGLRVYMPDSLRQKVQKIFAENIVLPKARRKG